MQTLKALTVGLVTAATIQMLAMTISLPAHAALRNQVNCVNADLSLKLTLDFQSRQLNDDERIEKMTLTRNTAVIASFSAREGTLNNSGTLVVAYANGSSSLSDLAFSGGAHIAVLHSMMIEFGHGPASVTFNYADEQPVSVPFYCH